MCRKVLEISNEVQISPEIRDIIGAEKNVATLNTCSLGSDSSDLERTPKTIRPFKLMDVDLPDRQEIKTSVAHGLSTPIGTESSRESENELNSQDQCTPPALPTRVITQVNLKRSAEFEIPEPIAKRTRAASRATSNRNNKPYVLITSFPNGQAKAMLETLGAIVVTDVMQCSVLLTQEIRRTFKLLCAVGLGKPIVGPSWLQACADTNMIVDPWLYTIKDEAAERRFNFSLQRTLSAPRGFLKGCHVSSTPSVRPVASELKLIVQCSGGTWRKGGKHWLCLSRAADRALWPALIDRGATLVTNELILGGVLRQTLDIEANKITVH